MSPAAQPSAHARKLVAEGFAKPLEAATFLGIGKTWLYDLIRVGAISHVRFGRRICIPWASVHEYAAVRVRHGSIA
jgi:excisionase family DNA binding protein